MRGWTVKESGGRDQLILKDMERPQPQKGDLLVEVKASGVNRLDINHRENAIEPYPTLGVEMSGIVVENHSDDERFSKGTHVAGIVNNGGYADYTVIPANRAMIFPEDYPFEKSTAVPEVFLTAFQTMYWIGDLQEKESILIHAAGSGVGTAAIQMARQISDAKIYATAGQTEKLQMAKDLGANVTINYKEENFAEVIAVESDGQGVDVILDFIGASYFDKNLESISIDGDWVVISTLGGEEIAGFSLRDMLAKRLTLHTTLLTPRSNEYKAKLTSDFEKTVMPYIADGRIKPVIYEVVPYEDAPRAHEIMENDENIGKIILKH